MTAVGINVLVVDDSDDLRDLITMVIRRHPEGWQVVGLDDYRAAGPDPLVADEHRWLFQRAAIIKRKFKAYEKYHPLADRTLVMISSRSSAVSKRSTKNSDAGTVRVAPPWPAITKLASSASAAARRSASGESPSYMKAAT